MRLFFSAFDVVETSTYLFFNTIQQQILFFTSKTAKTANNLRKVLPSHLVEKGCAF